MNKFIKENWFKLGVLVIILIAVGFFGYISYQYFVVNQKQSEADKVMNQGELTMCLNKAEKNYSGSWNTTCATMAGQEDSKFILCTQTNTNDYCTSHYSFATIPISGCSLPTVTANTLNNQLKNDKDNCFKEYPPK